MGFVYGFFIFVLIVVSVLLIAAILLQAGKGGGVAASFGGATSSTDAVFGTRQAGNILTKSSWWLGGIFLFLAFALQIASQRRGTAPESALDRAFQQPAAPAGAPAAPAGGAAPALPLEQQAAPAPAPGTTPPPAPQR